MSVANLSVITQPPGPLRSSWRKRRPESDNDENKAGSSVKTPRYSWYVTLESESPQPTDEDDESVYSVQGKETDYVADTSDTSTHTWVSSSDSGDLSLRVEYEVASMSEGPNLFDNNSSSSDVSDIVAMGVLTFCDSDLGLADDSDDSRSSVDSEIGTADYWTCIQCNAKNNNPMFRYCEKCYQIRKNFFPPRPKWRKSRLRVEAGIDNCDRNPLERGDTVKREVSSTDSGLGSGQERKYVTLELDLDAVAMPNNAATSAMPLSEDTGNGIDTGCPTILSTFTAKESMTTDTRPWFVTKNFVQGTENMRSGTSKSVNTSNFFEHQNNFGVAENKMHKYCDRTIDVATTTQGVNDSKLCITCTAAPKNGAFVHGAITHICCCYRCAVKVWSKTKRCPICNRKVTNVLKAFYT